MKFQDVKETFRILSPTTYPHLYSIGVLLGWSFPISPAFLRYIQRGSHSPCYHLSVNLCELRVPLINIIVLYPRPSTKRKHESEKQVSGLCCHSRGHASRFRSFSTRSNHHYQNRSSILYARRHRNTVHHGRQQ